ncbi:MAG: hypothetical protein K1Y36_30285, partial [Blastocatellia bacterium]|nr:hypothetical protein [Blastocatellia bacterium]
MTEPLIVNPNPPLNPGLDYAALKAEGLALIQQLAGDIWTDYNEHDPGVTTLEQVCYALTELSYRAEFPVQDLLLSHPQDRIRLHRQALFSARRIFTCNPVTEHDYRKLLVDRVPDVANAWLTPYRGRTPHKDVNGLYDIWLYVPNADPCVCAADYQPDMIQQQAKKTYNRHRNLCEDLHRITILQGVRTAVSADVTVLEARTPELILAEILFRVGNYLAPELQRQSLETLLAEGEAPSRIFNGPFLRHGFIDDAQLQPKAAEIPVRNVISVMANTPGVTSVTSVVVRVGKQEVKTYLPQATIPVPRNEILSLDTQPGGKRGNYSIRLFKNGIEYVPDSSRVQRELDRLWAAQRRTYDVLAEYEALFAVPQGTWRNVREYYSIQNQFPEVYGIGTYGLPLEAPQIRTAQARQFKGYLMVFDQLLADFFAQLAQLKNLYTLDPKVRHTYYFQSLRKSVPDVEPLLMDHYRAGLRQLIYGQDPFVERRNRFLSFLLAMYAETIAASDLVALTDREPSENAAGETLLAARQEFLQHLVAATHNRGRSFDYLAPASPRNMAGMEIKVRIQLGMEVRDRRPLIDVLEEDAVELVEHESEATLGRSSNRHADHIEQEFIPVTGEPEPTVTTDPPAGL